MTRYHLAFEFEFDSDNDEDYLESELGEHLEELIRKWEEHSALVKNVTGIGTWITKED